MLFLVLASFFVSKLGFVLSKSNSGDFTWRGFYAQKKQSVDLLFFGNSHLGNGLDGALLNSKNKINAYTLYSSGQTIPQTYYNIKEALKYQTPELIVIETFSITGDSIYFLGPESIAESELPLRIKHQSFDSKKFSVLKIEEFNDLYTPTDFFDIWFPYIKNHANWNDFEEIKSNLNVKGLENYFGTSNSIWPLNKSMAAKYKTTNFNIGNFNIAERQRRYLDEIVKLAKRNNIKILLLTMPYYNVFRDKIEYSSINKAISTYATSREIDFLDLNQVFPDLEYHYFSKEDIGHNQHLNYKGAIKITNYLSKYLNENYRIKSSTSNLQSLPEYFLYNDLLKKDSIDDGSKLIGYIDRINGSVSKTYRIKQGETPVIFDGWMLLEDKKAEDNEMFVGLIKSTDFIYVSKEQQFSRKIRKDVSKHFEKEKLYDGSGYQIRINSYLLEKGAYKIYLIIRNREGNVAVKWTGKRIEIE